ncbi:hypothetical protein NC651_018114 [Populus alba x Populus x berolinensis]|nr:hypothetical protein NC651_018114 [Populus alba x Populus x berolinensis]
MHGHRSWIETTLAKAGEWSRCSIGVREEIHRRLFIQFEVLSLTSMATVYNIINITIANPIYNIREEDGSFIRRTHFNKQKLFLRSELG